MVLIRGFALVLLTALAACAQPLAGPQVITELHDMSDAKFSLTVMAPRAIIREVAVCKAVWWAEMRQASTVSLSNPAYFDPAQHPPQVGRLAEGSVGLTATAYLTAPNPDHNPPVAVADKAPGCRAAFDWYH